MSGDAVDALLARREELVGELRSLDAELVRLAAAIHAAVHGALPTGRTATSPTKLAWVKARTAKRKAAGQCVRCGSPAAKWQDGRTMIYCERHRSIAATVGRDRYRAQKAAQP